MSVQGRNALHKLGGDLDDGDVALVDLCNGALDDPGQLAWIRHRSLGERDSMACNVLSLGDRKLIAIEENRRTNARLREHGFEVGTFHGSEISHNGGGGPTCLTRPILRA